MEVSRHRCNVIASVAILLAVPAHAQNNVPPELRDMARKVMMPVVYHVPGMDKVKIVQNLKYTKTDDPNVLMDLYLPSDATPGEKHPIVIFIHGGAKTEYTPKDWGVFTTWGRLAAASGFVGVTFTHRLQYPGKSLELAAQDVRAAIDYIRANADKYKADKDHIALVSYSAGGPILTLAMGGEMPFVRCLVGFYSFMDIRQSDYRKTETAEVLGRFSPITYLHEPDKIPPMFIARAGRDEVPTMDDSIDRFVTEALARNIALTLANYPQGVHGFDNQNNDDRSREIIRAALDFMKMHLGLASAVNQSSVAQRPAERDVLQFERDACKPFADADVAGLERVLTPDFTLTLSNGEVNTRADEINELGTGKVHYDVFENYDMLARLYGDNAAVVLGKTHVKGKADGKPFDRVVQFTDTLIKRGGQWQVAASHVSPLEK